MSDLVYSDADLNTTELELAETRVKITTASQVNIPLLCMSVNAIMCVICLLLSLKVTNNSKRKSDGDLESVDSTNSSSPLLRRSPYKLSGASRIVTSTAIFIMMALFFLTQGIENTCHTYLMTFLISTQLQITQTTGALINSAFGASYAIGSLIGVPIALILEPSAYIFVLMSLILLSSILFALFLDSSISMIWLASVLLGAGLSALFGNLISLTSQLVEFTNTIGAFVILSSVASSGLYPVMVGGIIDQEPIALIYQNAVSALLAMALAAGLLLYVRRACKQCARVDFS